MRKIGLFIALLGTLVVPMLLAAPANAQATRTWVSGVGDDANPCSRTAPCKTYAGAISKTAAGGEINCLDPGGFGALTITKSMTIICEYTEGGVTIAGTNAFIINAPAGSIVTLNGQDVECAGTGFNGILMTGVGVTLHVSKSKIRNCRAGNGINIAPSSGVGTVFISDSTITDNGVNVSSAGLLVRPTGGASANVSVSRTKLESNTNGIFADGSGGAGPCNISVKDSVLGGSSSNGIAISSTGGVFKALIDNTLINFNVGVGAAVAGAQATLTIGGSTITQNVTGVSNSGGTLQSFKNNQIAQNGTDGTPITAFPGPGGQALQ